MGKWEYDAPKDDPLTALRIPVTSSHPQWCYIVAFDVESAMRPSDAEAAMLVSYLSQYIDYWYNDSFKAKLAQRPFDVDGGANGVVFHKYGEDDWGYRRVSWTQGPIFWPGAPHYRDWLRRKQEADLGAHSLLAVMDHIESFGDGEPSPRWVAWKDAHPEVFGKAVGDRG